jgi:NADH-ubiquinone oxidoreductase chain 5
MSIPLFLLSFGALFIGYLTKDLIIGLSINTWEEAVLVKTKDWVFFEAEYLDDFIKDIPLLFGIMGSLCGSYLYSEEIFSTLWFKWKLTNNGRAIYSFLNRKWFFDKIYNELISQNILNIAYKQTYQTIDRGILEFLGPHGFSIVIYKRTLDINNITLDYIYHYLLLLLYGIITFLTISVYWTNFIYFVDGNSLILLIIGFFLLKEVVFKKKKNNK